MSAFDVLPARATDRSTPIDMPVIPALAKTRSASPAWAARSLGERVAVLDAAVSLMAGEADTLATAIRVVSRRPASEVWSGDIVPTLDALRWLAHDGVKVLCPAKLSRARMQWYFRAARHELTFDPHGVIGIVTPSNSLLFLAVPQIAAALVAGNTVVWKPAPAGADVATHVASIFRRAGLPEDALVILHGGAEAARHLVIAGVDKLHFTGGTAAGLELYRMQAARGRPAVLELSGRHIAIVLDDADPHLAARGIAWGKLVNGGRNCISVQLVLVTRGVADAVLDALGGVLASARLEELAPEETWRLTSLVDDAVARGARLVSGASWPALIAGVRPGMRVVDEEIQGPILAVATVESAASAIRWVNSAAHRLSASIWTRSPASGRGIAGLLDVGQVWINEQIHPAAHPEVTLAGRGRSGFGATRGIAGLLEMVQPKVISEMPLGVRRRHYVPSDDMAVELFRATARLGGSSDVGQRVNALGSMARALLWLVRRQS